ncbi:MAG: hypothetical protein ACRCYX_10300 [Dermatophilaceae bacterium]
MSRPVAVARGPRWFDSTTRMTPARRSVLVVDEANVVGSRPDGWWRDRPGAAARLPAVVAAVASPLRRRHRHSRGVTAVRVWAQEPLPPLESPDAVIPAH